MPDLELCEGCPHYDQRLILVGGQRLCRYCAAGEQDQDPAPELLNVTHPDEVAKLLERMGHGRRRAE